MTYRDDLDAAGHRADALAVDLDAAEREKAELAGKLEAVQRENEELRAKLATAPRPAPAPVRLPPPPAGEDLDLGGDRRYLRMGVSALGFTLQWSFYLLFPLLGFFFTLPVRLAVSERAGLYVLLVIPAAMLGFALAGQLVIGRAEARVRGWLAAVPFPVEGFFGMFVGSGSPSHRHRFVAKVVFAGAVPANAVEILTTDTMPISVREQVPVLELDCDVLGGATQSEAGSYRRLVTSAQHLVDDLLVPLHARAPIARLELRPR